MSPDPDRLIRQLGAGGRRRESALETLYRDYAGRFAAYLRRRGTADQDVEDLVQEAFVRIVRGAGGFSSTGAGHAWLWTVARSAWLDAARARRREPVVGADPPPAESDFGQMPDIAGPSDFEDCVQGQLDRFARQYPEGGQAVIWAAVDGLSTRQIAEALGRSAGATREFLSSTRKRLREFLAPCLT